LRYFGLLVLVFLQIVDNLDKMKPIKVPEQSTLADVAAHRLAQSIVTGELAQGQKLNEAELAERFGMGRGPLREALRHLEGMRLVKRIPNAGARVVVLDRKTLSDLYAVREMLEGMACRLAAALMSDDEIAQLNTLLDKHEEQIKKQGGKVYSQSEGDLDFHYQIVRGSRNQMLMDLLGSEQYQLLRMCRYRTSRNAQRTKPALLQHRQIVDALTHRDGELAEMLMRRHIQGAWHSISEMIDKEEKKESAV
jgi:DNA-binding GntR family transcriptional regulator